MDVTTRIWAVTPSLDLQMATAKTADATAMAMKGSKPKGERANEPKAVLYKAKRQGGGQKG